MRSHRTWLTAITLLVLGIVSFALQPVLDPKPDSVCVKDGAPSSGFVDSDKDDCPISDARYAKIADWESSPKPFRIVGLVLVVAGLVAGAVAVMRHRRSDGAVEPDS